MKQEILYHMAKAFFASAWADMAEETGNSGIMSGAEIMDIMPDEIDESAIRAANTLCMDMESANGRDIETLFNDLCEASEGAGDREHTPRMFGHYAAMQAMGHGVGLGDAFGQPARALMDNGKFIVPYVEFGAYSLSKDYFPEE